MASSRDHRGLMSPDQETCIECGKSSTGFWNCMASKREIAFCCECAMKVLPVLIADAVVTPTLDVGNLEQSVVSRFRQGAAHRIQQDAEAAQRGAETE